MGLFKKVGDFLGVSKFGQAVSTLKPVGKIAAALDGEQFIDPTQQAAQDTANNTANVQKILYVARKEQNPEKKKQLLNLAKNFGADVTSEEINPGLGLSNKEVLGSAANVVLNVATPGAFKGTPLTQIGKNMALGGAFGAASGLEKDRDVEGVIGSTMGGALIGGGVGVAGVLAKAAKNFVGTTVPTHIMNKAVKPALQDLKKNVRFGSKTLGQELLEDGVKGGPKRLLEIADDKLTSLEDDLQKTLNDPHLAEARINRDQIFPHLREMLLQKKKVPGGRNEMLKIKEIYNDIPEEMTLAQANEIKRAIYKELRDPAYKLDAALTTKSAALKNIAKGLKTEIENTVGGTVVKDINQKLSVYGRLENSMVDQLAREMRNNGIGLTDAILAAGGPTTSILALLRHVGQGVETYTAQALHKVQGVGTGVVGKTLKNVAKKATLNAP